MFASRTVTAALAVLLTGAAFQAKAVTITFDQNDLALSTSGVNPVIPPTGVDPSNIPGDSTFTLPFNGSLSTNQGKWFRYNFTLPAGFTNISMNIELSVDNTGQVFLNDQIAAIESDVVVANFNSPYPEFTLAADGTVTNDSGTWNSLPISQSMFQNGVNELTFYMRDNGSTGAFSLFTSTITYDEASAPVPAILPLFGIGGLALVAARRRRIQ